MLNKNRKPQYKNNPLAQHPYLGIVDLVEMANLVEASQSENLHFCDLPYRFGSWAFDDPENVRLWFDQSGHLVAWAVMQSPFWSIDYALAPGMHSSLHRQVLEWADQRAREILPTPFGHPCWFVNAFSGQAQRIQDLESLGFTNQAAVSVDSWTKVFMERSAGLPIREFRLPPGFTIRPLQGTTEVPGYVDLHRKVFESTSMTVEWRLRTLHQPGYRPDLDLVAVAPDGRLAAFCLAWFRQLPGGRSVGQIEPLGCHPDFRRYALGRLVLVDAIRRLQAAGASSIFVETDNYRSTAFALYESLGFKVVQQVYVFRKNYGEIDE